MRVAAATNATGQCRPDFIYPVKSLQRLGSGVEISHTNRLQRRNIGVARPPRSHASHECCTAATVRPEPDRREL